MTMRTLVTGCNGQLGQALAESARTGADVIGVDLPQLDITDAVAVLEFCRSEKPRLIINAAAYTAVDQAESDAETAAAVNVHGAHNVAVAARDIGARLIHISTDFVFDGEATKPYKPDAVPGPVSVYGQTKLDGELAVRDVLPDAAVIVRTSWLYSKTGNNFVKTILRLMHERSEISVVADQVGTPTWAGSLAAALWVVSEKPELTGVFHWTDGGKASWHEFAVAIQQEAVELGILAAAIPVYPIAAAEYPSAAARPAYSVLDTTATCAALELRPEPWRANLRRMLKGLVS